MVFWCIQPFGRNRHGPKSRGCYAPLGVAGSPPNTMWPWSRPTTILSGILIHPTVWPQYINVTDRTDRTDNGPIVSRSNRFTNDRPKTECVRVSNLKLSFNKVKITVRCARSSSGHFSRHRSILDDVTHNWTEIGQLQQLTGLLPDLADRKTT